MSHGLNLHSAVNVVAQVPGVGISIANGTSVPASGDVGYAPGCVYVKLDGTGESNVFYVNLGTRASASFSAIDLNASEAALLSGLLATSAEINRCCDVSTRTVPLAVSTAITEADHSSRTIVMGGAGSARTFTLPASSVGLKFRFVVGAVNTSNYLIKSVTGADVFRGTILGASTTDSANEAARTWPSGSTDDTITLNGTTTGGAKIGDYIDIECIAANAWHVSGFVTQSGVEATPFSDTVA